MKIQHWLPPWVRLLLWLHAAGVAIFYLFVWFRTAPPEDEKRATRRSRQRARGSSTIRLAPTAGGMAVGIPAVSPSPQGTIHRAPTLPSMMPGEFVSIIVPARNEENNIRRCVTALLEQDHEHFEVIVVDDDSTDRTPAILDDIVLTHPRCDRLRVLRLRELPAGWAGKPHALHAGVQEARGDWLLFTDADTWHAPNALSSSLTRATDEDIDLLTLASKQELNGFWNKVMMPMAFLGISMQYPSKLVNDPFSPVAIANGQYILMRRAVYEAIGGYARPNLRATLLDDRDLAYVVKEQGFRLRFVDGRDLVHVRMYRDLRETWRGWRKNAFLGSRGGLPYMMLQLIGLPMVSILPFLLPLVFIRRAGRTHKFASREAGVITLLELGPLLAYGVWADNAMDIPWYYAFTHPLAGVMFEGILAQSTWRILTRKGVDWRGRQYYNK